MIREFEWTSLLNMQSLMRFLRILIGAAILWQAFIENSWMLSVPGLFFLYQGITNIGCEAHGNCKI